MVLKCKKAKKAVLAYEKRTGNTVDDLILVLEDDIMGFLLDKGEDSWAASIREARSLIQACYEI